MATVFLDAGHGGVNPGATFEGRRESDDALELTLAIGNILEENGIDVEYSRVNDIYESPTQKAREANESGADYFVSIHRNSSVKPEQYSGIETLVYARGLRSEELANNINRELEQVGFINLGISERPNLAVLRRTKMPAVLVEVGFINTARDNELLDTRFYEVANAIAEGIIETVY